ncbi:MAG: hypothetical protein P8Z37_18995, partial [Acidobacteriota bacterium]
MATSTPRAAHLYLFQEDLRYDRMAENLGVRGEYVQTPEDLRAALGRSYDAASKRGYSTLINCRGLGDFNLEDRYPSGLDFSPEPGIGAIKH